jgi:hypothetical protein
LSVTAKLKQLIVDNYSQRNRSRSNLVCDRLASNKADVDFQINMNIANNSSLLFGRLGGLEANCLGLYLDSQNFFKSPIRKIQSLALLNYRQRQLLTNAGIYPMTKETFEYFCIEHFEALDMLDIFSVWGKPFAWIESNYLNQDKVLFVSGDYSYPSFEPRDIESKFGWAWALNEKKVLVVSPFADSLRIQFSKFKDIYLGLDLPEISFEVLKAPMTQGGLRDDQSYAIHLNRMKESLEKFDFDVALVSAGGYSLPLAAHAKQIGKIGIHAGGAMQIFFGILGQRYENYPQVKKYLNKDWKRPFEHERPKNWESIEGGCYW